MSGHSKWASIKHKKGALDAKRGKIFTKIIREMSIAARIGGGDPNSNPRLRTAIDKDKECEEKLMDLALDAGADDIVGSGEVWEVYTSPNTYEAVLASVKKAGIEPEESEIGKYAENNITLEGVKAQQMLKLIEALEDSDDVQNVWSNFDISDKELEAAAAAG